MIEEFECPVCDRTYKVEHFLVKHIAKHHPEYVAGILEDNKPELKEEMPKSPISFEEEVNDSPEVQESILIEVEETSEMHQQLITLFKNRNTENISLNLEQKSLIHDAYKKEFKITIDSSCTHQVINAYIALYKLIKSLYEA